MKQIFGHFIFQIREINSIFLKLNQNIFIAAAWFTGMMVVQEVKWESSVGLRNDFRKYFIELSTNNVRLQKPQCLSMLSSDRNGIEIVSNRKIEFPFRLIALFEHKFLMLCYFGIVTQKHNDRILNKT